MNYKKLYPLTIPLVENHPELISDIIISVRPHKEGCFAGVSLLEGCYYIENREMIYDSLTVGEELKITPDANITKYVRSLLVTRSDGTQLGYIPKKFCALLNMLLERDIGIFAYCEAKSYSGDILKIAVSVYFDRY